MGCSLVLTSKGDKLFFCQLACLNRFVSTFQQKKAWLVFFPPLMAIFQAQQWTSTRTTRLEQHVSTSGTEIIRVFSSPGLDLFGHLSNSSMSNACSQNSGHFLQFAVVVLVVVKKIQHQLTPNQPNLKNRLNLLGVTRILMWFI